jgi:hypothetical protein
MSSHGGDFGIYFISDSQSEAAGYDATGALGRIRVGDLDEYFKVALGFWGKTDYCRSWRRAFEVLAGSSPSVSCLITSMTNPETSNFIFCWPLYRDGERVYVRNSVIFLGELSEKFDPDNPWKVLPERHVFNEDGVKISEWITDISSLKGFFSAIDQE